MFGFPKGDAGKPTLPACVWNPADHTWKDLTGFRNNFCSGHVTLANGKVLIVGGHVGELLKDVVVFDPITAVWTVKPKMTVPRWYPIVVPLPDGRALILGGAHGIGWTTNVENTWQLVSPSGDLGVTGPIPVPFSPHFPAAAPAMDLYPQAFVTPNRQLLVHSRNTTRFLSLDTMGWTPTILKTVANDSRTYPFMGGFAMLPLRKGENYRVRVIIAGGRPQSAGMVPGAPEPSNDLPGLASAEILDLSLPQPAWVSIAPLNEGRSMADLLTLPDGTVLLIGGNRFGRADVGNGPTLRPELYDPVKNTWTSLASTKIPRGYHGSALLLPDGSVAILGKDGDFQGPGLKYAETRVEIFEPPYLHKDNGTRPVIQTCPAAITFGQSFTLNLAAGTVAANIREVVICRTGSTTHQVNTSQHIVELVKTANTTSSLQLTAPPDGYHAPPGFYMLFLIGTNGVPSVSKMVHLTGPGTVLGALDAPYRAQRSTGTVALSDAGEAPRCQTPDVAGQFDADDTQRI